MKEVIDFVENFLQHSKYDPVKAREYYLRTRELKGRQAAKPADPRSKLSFAGGPLKPLGKRIEEDETPVASPSGAKLTIYDQGPHGLGRATFADGTVYDAKTGWSGGSAATKAASAKAVIDNAAKRAAYEAKNGKPGAKNTTATKKRRVAQAEQKLKRARKLANGIKNQQRRRDVLRRLQNAERKLDSTRRKYGSTKTVTRRRSGV